ncbi:MAG: UDP-N-acetylmuramate--L-alanine ligase, partial [Chloroflexi bacterium]|nr:UDP-N-acetylmuramate--L-alanine ligase [Chloroflexota bacterium]
FESKGTASGITVVDDYGHHPTEIRATLAAARQRFPGRPIWCAFQPHTYSRTKALLHDFAQAFGDADHIAIIDVYAARETQGQGIGSADLARAIVHPDVCYVGGLHQAKEHLLRRLQCGDVLMTVGAGNVWTVGDEVLQALGEES